MQLLPRIDLVAMLILVGVFQSFCFAFIYLFKAKRSKEIFEGILMLILGLIGLESFLNFSGFIMYTPWMVNLSPPLVLTIGPIWYLILKKNNSELPNSKWLVFHFIPALFYLAYSAFFYTQPSEFKIKAVLHSFHPNLFQKSIFSAIQTDPLNIQGWVVVEGLGLHLLAYSAISISILWRSFRKQEIKLLIQKPDSTWLIYWSGIFFIGSIVFLMTGGIVNGRHVYPQILPNYAINIYSTIIIYGATLLKLGQTIVHDVKKVKYVKSALQKHQEREILARLYEIMAYQKPYKSIDFNIGTLAQMANVSVHHTSQAINSGAGKSFNDFVNYFRIEDAKTILRSSTSVKIESLAYELGYKSKSAFFVSFKNLTSVTPAKFRTLSPDSLK